MCTVVIRIPHATGEPVRLLAVRDEDPARPWRTLGPWWPDLPNVLGVQDQLAGGAWLAADPCASKVAMIVNRVGTPSVETITSRGTLVLDAMRGLPLASSPTTLGFHLIEATPHGASVATWDGTRLDRQSLEPGTHMIAHDCVDDPTTPRIAAWREVFSQASTRGEPWYAEWLAVLEQTTALPPTDERAIIRDNRPYGYPTQSLLIVAADVTTDGVRLHPAKLPEPGFLPKGLTRDLP